MALPLIPLLLLGLGGAAVVAASGKKKSRSGTKGNRRPRCKGMEDLHALAKSGSPIDVQIARAVEVPLNQPPESVTFIDPPKALGLADSIGGSPSRGWPGRSVAIGNRQVYTYAREAYRRLGCGDPPMPGKGTLSQRLLFALVCENSSALAMDQVEVEHAPLPNRYVVGNAPEMTEAELRGLVTDLSQPKASLKGSSSLDRFEAPNTRLEEELLRSYMDLQSYNRGGPLFGSSGLKPARLPAIFGAPEMVVQHMAYRLTRKYAPTGHGPWDEQSVFWALVRTAGALMDCQDPDGGYCSNRITILRVGDEDGALPYFVTADRDGITRAVRMAKVMMDRGQFPNDEEAAAAAAMEMSRVIMAQDLDEFGKNLPNYLVPVISNAHRPLQNIFDSESDPGRRSEAMSELELSYPVMWSIHSTIVDALLDPDSIEFG